MNGFVDYEFCNFFLLGGFGYQVVLYCVVQKFFGIGNQYVVWFGKVEGGM